MIERRRSASELSRHYPQPDLARRNALKILVACGAVIPLIPLSLLGEVLSPPGEFGTTKYPRVRIANLKDLSPNSSLIFEYPNKGRPAILVRLADSRYTAFDASCTHLGCQIHYNTSQRNFCPCHGGTFDSATGAVLAGPPPRPLPKIKLDIDGNGDIYADGYESGLPLYGEG